MKSVVAHKANSKMNSGFDSRLRNLRFLINHFTLVFFQLYILARIEMTIICVSPMVTVIS